MGVDTCTFDQWVGAWVLGGCWLPGCFWLLVPGRLLLLVLAVRCWLLQQFDACRAGWWLPSAAWLPPCPHAAT